MDNKSLGINPFVIGIALEDGIGQRDGGHVVEVGNQLGHVEGLAVAAKDVGVVPCVILNGSADVFSTDVGVVVDKSDVVSDNTVAIVSCSTEVECSVDNTSLSAAEVDSVSCIAVAGEEALLLAQQEAYILFGVVDLSQGQVEDCDGVEAISAEDTRQSVTRTGIYPFVGSGIVVECALRSILTILISVTIDPGEVVADNLIFHTDGIGTNQEVQHCGAVATCGIEATGNRECGVEIFATVAVSGVEYIVISVVAIVGDDLVIAGGSHIDG